MTAIEDVESQTVLASVEEWELTPFHGDITEWEQFTPTAKELKVYKLCHALVGAIPPEGLEDLLKTLIDICTFYVVSRKEPLALPPPVRRKEAICRGRVERPPFVIEIDEV